MQEQKIKGYLELLQFKDSIGKFVAAISFLFAFAGTGLFIYLYTYYRNKRIIELSPEFAQAEGITASGFDNFGLNELLILLTSAVIGLICLRVISQMASAILQQSEDKENS